MILTAETILLYLVALFLTVATLWAFSYGTEAISLKADPRTFLVLIILVVPYAMLIYFGVAFIISDTIGDIGAVSPDNELSSLESLVVAVSYVGLSGWLWLRWRNPIALSTKILGPVIIATVIILITIDVIWAAHHEHII
jgi:hypothetical protein